MKRGHVRNGLCRRYHEWIARRRSHTRKRLVAFAGSHRRWWPGNAERARHNVAWVIGKELQLDARLVPRMPRTFSDLSMREIIRSTALVQKGASLALIKVTQREQVKLRDIRERMLADGAKPPSRLLRAIELGDEIVADLSQAVAGFDQVEAILETPEVVRERGPKA